MFIKNKLAVPITILCTVAPGIKLKELCLVTGDNRFRRPVNTLFVTILTFIMMIKLLFIVDRNL